MKTIKLSESENYGNVLDMRLTNVMIRYNLKKDSIHIFFGNGINPVYVPKGSAIYNNLVSQFKGAAKNDLN